MHFSTVTAILSLAAASMAAPAEVKRDQFHDVVNTLVKQIDSQPNGWGWLPFQEAKVQPPCPDRASSVARITTFCATSTGYCQNIADIGTWGTLTAQELVDAMYPKASSKVKRDQFHDVVNTLVKQIDSQPNGWGWLPFQEAKVQPPCPDRASSVARITTFCATSTGYCQNIADIGTWGTLTAQELVDAMYPKVNSKVKRDQFHDVVNTLVKQIDSQPNGWGWLPFQEAKVQPPCPDRASSVARITTFCATSTGYCQNIADIGTWGTLTAQELVDAMYPKGN